MIYKTCILTVIKNEHQYLEEWIKYHLNLGIDHLFIFEDIGSQSHKAITDNYSQVSLLSVDILIKDINPYILKRITKQTIYNKEGLNWIKKNYDYNWCFCIDVDEYVTLTNENDSLQDVMNRFSDYDAVIMQWQNYNANGHIFKPDYSDKGIIETYTQKCGKSINDASWKSTKIVFNLKTLKNYYFLGIHKCNELCKWCKSDLSTQRFYQSYDNLYLRHYITKSWEEYVWKLNVRGMFHPDHRDYKEFFEMNPDLKDREEELINIKNIIINKLSKMNYENYLSYPVSVKEAVQPGYKADWKAEQPLTPEETVETPTEPEDPNKPEEPVEPVVTPLDPDNSSDPTEPETPTEPSSEEQTTEPGSDPEVDPNAE